VQAAVELFGEVGYASTTTDAIAARAEVSPRTFFHHFPTKEDVLFDGYADRLVEVTTRFREADPEASVWDALSAAAMAVIDVIEAQSGTFLRRAQLYEEVPALRATMLRINEEWIDGLAGEVRRRLGVRRRDDLRPRLTATLVNAANRAAIERWAASGGRADLRAVAEEALSYVRPAIEQMYPP
jgi:AcrR family transcriptional regulator